MSRQGSSYLALPKPVRLPVAAAVFAVLFWAPRAGQTQVSQSPPPVNPGSARQPSNSDLFGPPPAASPGTAMKLEHMREDERHKRLQADTARLVALTNELKADVDKAAKDELSLDVVRKAAEIEKLAHDVKERMKS